MTALTIITWIIGLGIAARVLVIMMDGLYRFARLEGIRDARRSAQRRQANARMRCVCEHLEEAHR